MVHASSFEISCQGRGRAAQSARVGATRPSQEKELVRTVNGAVTDRPVKVVMVDGRSKYAFLSTNAMFADLGSSANPVRCLSRLEIVHRNALRSEINVGWDL
jgi:hypothetical protein